MYGGVYRIGFSPHYCIVFHYIWDKKSTAVQLISCQLFGQLISLELKSHTLETTFTPEQSICTLRDLTTSNLAYVAVLLDGQRPTFVVSMKISFSSWVEGLFCQNVALHCVLHDEYLTFPTLDRDQLNRNYFPLLAAHRISDSKISVANPS